MERYSSLFPNYTSRGKKEANIENMHNNNNIIRELSNHEFAIPLSENSLIVYLHGIVKIEGGVCCVGAGDGTLCYSSIRDKLKTRTISPYLPSTIDCLVASNINNDND